MQISSQNDTQSILSIARQSALGKSSKDKSGSETDSSFQSSLSSAGVSFSQGYTSLQNTLAEASISDTSTATSGAAGIVASGGGLMSDALTKSDWDLIQKTTGLTRGEGHLVTFTDSDGNEVDSGAAYEQAGAMVFAMADMRIYAAEFGASGDMFSGTGDITPEQLEQYFAKYQSAAASGSGPFSSTVISDLDKALST